MSEYKPPIESRSTFELLEIVGNEKEWQIDATKKAYKELKKRKVKSAVINQFKIDNEEYKKYLKEEMAKESYKIIDFIFEPFSFVFVLFFQWELKRDGYFRKARQLMRIRLVVLVLILWIILYFRLT